MVEAGGEALQGAPRVVRGEHHAARRKRRALLQMQVGDEQGVLGLPIAGAGCNRQEGMAGKFDGRPPSSENFRHQAQQGPPSPPLSDLPLLRATAPRLRPPGTLSRPISSMAGTASGETRSSGICLILPRIRCKKPLKRPTSIRPVAASAKAA